MENDIKVFHLGFFVVVFGGVWVFFFLLPVTEKEASADSLNETAEPHGPLGSSYLASK